MDITIHTTDDAATTRESIVRAINLESERTGVTAIDTGTIEGGITLVAKDGRNIMLENTDGLAAGATGLDLAAAANNATFATGSVTLVA
ncbi:MAG: hypothetical protein MZV65_41045 [Chromatiales bacterium]|nr:hypothetical protein [Chromatiales bacterium]